MSENPSISSACNCEVELLLPNISYDLVPVIVSAVPNIRKKDGIFKDYEVDVKLVSSSSNRIDIGVNFSKGKAKILESLQNEFDESKKTKKKLFGCFRKDKSLYEQLEDSEHFALGIRLNFKTDEKNDYIIEEQLSPIACLCPKNKPTNSCLPPQIDDYLQKIDDDNELAVKGLEVILLYAILKYFGYTCFQFL